MEPAAKNLLLDELLSICDRINEPYDIVTVSPLICEFAEKFISDPLLKPILIELNKEKQSDCANQNAELKNTSQWLWPACEDGVAYIEKNDIKYPAAVTELIWFKSRELSSNNIWIQRCAFARFLRALLNDTPTNHSNFIKKYATVDESNPTQPIKLFSEFELDKLQKEDNSLTRIMQLRAWHSLEQLESIYVIFHPKAYEEYKNILKDERPISKMILDIRYSALDRAINPATRSEFHEEGFNVKDKKDHMQRLYHYARKKLLLTNTAPQKKKSKQKQHMLTWEPENLCLTIDGQSVHHNFIKGKSLTKLLNLFIKNGKFAKNINLLRIYNEVNGESENKLDGKIEKAARGYCRELNDIFPKEYPRFLCTNNKVVNPNLCYVLEP